LPGATGRRISANVAELLVLAFTASDMGLSGWAGRQERISAALVAEPNATDRSIGRRLVGRHSLIGG
jgi:hypothetical protein